MAKFWPGGLTVIVAANSALAWDLGDTRGTVALRMPDNRIALDVLADPSVSIVSLGGNAGTGKSEGFEFEIAARATENLRITASYSMADAKFVRARDGSLRSSRLTWSAIVG